jgi:PTH2 family peptidyl-tRNA hydrolase
MLKQVIVMRTDLNMRKGKMAAQAAHAQTVMMCHRKWMKFEGMDDETNLLTIKIKKQDLMWMVGLHTKIVVGIGSENELLEMIKKAEGYGIDAWAVYDAGVTEFHGNKTLTCAAFGPADESILDPLTGGLKLL